MRLLRGLFCDEMKLAYCNLARRYCNSDKGKIDPNTLTLAVHFTNEELSKILQYDREKQRNDEKIIVEAVKLDRNIVNKIITNPINLKGAVKSDLITKLEIAAQGNEYYSFKSPALQLIEECEFEHLHIITLMHFTFQPSHVEDIIRLINVYKGTLKNLMFHFEKINMTDFSKIYEGVEHWIINKPIGHL